MSINVKINKLSLKNIKHPANILILGYRNMGKTWFINDFLFHVENLKTVNIYSTNKYYDKINEVNYFDEYDENTSNDINIFEDCFVTNSRLAKFPSRHNNNLKLNNGKTNIIVVQHAFLESIKFDYFILYFFGKTSTRDVYDKYFKDMFLEFESFNEFYEICTRGYKCMVIDKNVESPTIESMVKWYFAEERTNFKHRISALSLKLPYLDVKFRFL